MLHQQLVKDKEERIALFFFSLSFFLFFSFPRTDHTSWIGCGHLTPIFIASLLHTSPLKNSVALSTHEICIIKLQICSAPSRTDLEARKCPGPFSYGPGFSTGGRAHTSSEHRKATPAALYHRRNVKIAPSCTQCFRVFVIIHFIFFPFTVFCLSFLCASFLSCHSSVFQLLLISASLSISAFLTYFSFYLHIFPSFSLSTSAPRLFLSFQCFPLFYTLIPPLTPSP